jgi:TonB family protein
MINLKPALIAVLAIGTMCRAEDKGFCPPTPPANIATPKKAAAPASSAPDKKYFGTVTLLAVISDKGYVCSVHTLRGPSKEFNKKAETAVRGWHFDPARKDGHALPVVVTVDVNYWTTSTGEIVSDPPQSQSPALPEEVGSKPVQ